MHGGDIYRNKIEVDFSVNINPCGIPDSVKTVMLNAINDLTGYPDIECEELNKRIACRFGVDYKDVVCGNGASELILAICNGLKPSTVMVTAPSFLGYEKAVKAVGAKISFFYLDKNDDFKLDIDLFIEDIREERPELIFITNPNNPNGEVIEVADIRRIAKACAEVGAILIIDECFAELSTKRISFCGELDNYRNVIILRAFTKSFAIPGVRLGFVLCRNEALVKKIKEQLPEWNVSLIAQRAGIQALEEEKFLEISREVIQTEREYLRANLEENKIKVYSSQANYLLLETDRPLKDELLKYGLLIRDCSNYEGLCKNFYRIAVKLRSENEKLIAAIRGEYKPAKKEEIEYVLPGDIEKRSFEIIGKECLERGIYIPEEQLEVTKRVIHTSADFEYAKTLTYSENAIAIARELILKGADIVTDTNMAKAGINKATLAKFGGEVHCFMADEDVAIEAKSRHVTRATVSMEKAAKIDKPVIFAIGNAPTALIALKELMDNTGFRPAFVIGVPVGFVNVVAAKELIINTDVPYIVNRGRKGGSNVAAAICNALMYGLITRE